MNATQMRSNIFSRWYKEHTFPGNQKWSFLYLIENHTTFHFLLRCLKIIRLGHYVYTYQISHAFMEWEIFLPPLILTFTELNSFCLGFENRIQYFYQGKIASNLLWNGQYLYIFISIKATNMILRKLILISEQVRRML